MPESRRPDMENAPLNYRREFLHSRLHLWVGFLTLGAGFISAEPLGLLAGAAAYALSWIYVPDLPFFRRRVDRQKEDEILAVQMAQTREFVRKRDAQMMALTGSRQQRYQTLALVCQDIERATGEASGGGRDQALDTRLRKLEELMWTYLRLLTIEQSLEVFLETERKEDVPRLARENEEECNRLSTDMEALKKQGGGASADSKQRLLNSRRERQDVLQKRLQRAEQAQENLSLSISEEERLEQQIKLIRADAVASKNADVLSARIDASVQHLEQTNKWLSEMSEFKDLVGDLPPADMRIGFGAVVQPTAPPPVPRKIRPVLSMKD